MSSFIAKFYLVCGIGLLGGFSYTSLTGWERGTEKRRFIPSEVRTDTGPSGIRGFHFWHVGYGGYRGGK